jgi:glycosyltransferase involved in cell wall biosynthesis
MKRAEFGRQAIMPDPVRILFMASADFDNTNAQSLNAREIALRLDPERFVSTLFYQHPPDPRLGKRPNIRLVRLPARNRTWRIVREMLGHPRLITYIDYSPAAYMFLHLPSALRKETITVLHVEAPAAQLSEATRSLRFLYDGVTPRCTVHTAITDFVLRDMQSRGYSSEYILPVGVDTNLFVPPAVRQNPQPVVLFVGTIIERKGAHLVVEAARQIPEAQFRIVGSGRDGFEEKLRQQVREFDLTNIQFLGPQRQPALVETMQQSDVFLLPSRLEGIPKVTLEAAATGLPCVVFRDYETPSVIDGKTGFQVATFDEMIDRLRCLLQYPHLRLEMSAAALLHARSFDWNLVARRWEEAYLRMAAG